MDYSLVTLKDLDTRYNYLPSTVRTLLDSEGVLVKIDVICRNNHITDDDKRVTVVQLVSLVLLGVLHIDDLAGEIDHYLLLNNYKFSKEFADEITKKIFEPVKDEIEKNYRPITQPIREMQMGAAAVKMTPEAPVSGAKPIPLGQLQSKDAFAKPLTPPSFSPQPKPMPPSFGPPMPPQRIMPTPPPVSASNNFQSKNPPLDLSQKHAETQLRHDGDTMEIQSRRGGEAVEAQLKKVEIKKEAPVMPVKDTFGMGAEIKKLEQAGNELVEVLKKREEVEEDEQRDKLNRDMRQGRGGADTQLRYDGDTIKDKEGGRIETPLRYGGDAIGSKKEETVPIQPNIPKQAPILEIRKGSQGENPNFSTGRAPVMIHQETATQPIRPNVDFKLNFPQVRPIESFGQKGEMSKMAKIEIGGTTEKQLEGVVKSPVIQPPKVVHYSAFQTPVERDMLGSDKGQGGGAAQNQSQTPLSQSPFVQTGKGYGDMRKVVDTETQSKYSGDKKTDMQLRYNRDTIETQLKDKIDAPLKHDGGMIEKKPINPQGIKTVNFVGDGEISDRETMDARWKAGQIQEEKPKRGWLARLLGKKEENTIDIQSKYDRNAVDTQLKRERETGEMKKEAPISPARAATPAFVPPIPLARSTSPIPPAPAIPPKPPLPASMFKTENVEKFAGVPKEQLSPVTLMTQDIKPLGPRMDDSDIIDLNTMQKIKK